MGLSRALTWTAVGPGAAAAAASRRQAAAAERAAARVSAADTGAEPQPFMLEVPIGANAAAASVAAAAAATGSASSVSAASLHESLHVRCVRGPGTIIVPARCKAVLLEDCGDMLLRLPAGALATVDLLRCRRVDVEIGASVSCVKVDDSEDISLVFLDAASTADVSVFSTGSRKVRVAAQRQKIGGSEVSSLLPETFHTRLTAGVDAFVHTVVDHSNPWGVA